MSETLNPFLSDGTWLRGGLHAHTPNFDGELAPDKLAGRAGSRAWTNPLWI